VQVVPRASAVVFGAVNSELIVIHSDHINMVKFASKDDSGYQTISGHLQIMTQDASEVISSRWEAEGKVNAAIQPTKAPEPGYDKFGYRIDDIVDRGGYGIVAKARHYDKSDVLYARKQLPKSFIKREELEKEVALIRKAKHRHVVELVDEYEDECWYYIVMLPFATSNLQQYLQDMISKRPTDKESWADFGTQRLQLFQWIYCLAVTLKDLHIRNIRHRDIKPQNILVHGSNILLTDFGISFSHDGVTKVALTTTVGTEKYEPPEAFQESSDNTRKRIRTGRLGDVFSLGCVIFEMLEALSGPVLKTAFPPVRDSYSSCVGDHGFLSQVGEVKEHEVLSRRLPEDYRFFGLTEALLGKVMSAMMTLVQNRKTAAVVVDLLEQPVTEWALSLSDCCIRHAGAVMEEI
jgi:serine/threonine protein kinase